MSFIVEDGTGVEGANAYVTLEFADNYFSTRGVSIWAEQTEAVKQQALVKASDFIDAKFGNRFQLNALNPLQGLVLPRVYFLDNAFNKVQGIPLLWLKAVCEYAMVSLTRSLYSTPTDTGKEVKVEEITVGPIKTKVEFLDTPSQGSFISFPSADRLVLQLLGSNASRVIR